jgi:hypothetical protein
MFPFIETFVVSLYGNLISFYMTRKFNVLFMEDTREFLAWVDQKSKDKIILNFKSKLLWQRKIK